MRLEQFRVPCLISDRTRQSEARVEIWRAKVAHDVAANLTRSARKRDEIEQVTLKVLRDHGA